jgi:hypothetical protein
MDAVNLDDLLPRIASLVLLEVVMDGQAIHRPTPAKD